MGHYSTLQIGKVDFQWKSYMPPIAMYLFAPDEYKFIKKLDEDGEGEYLEQCGYNTTARKARLRLENMGFDINLFIKFYEILDYELEGYYEYIAGKYNINNMEQSSELSIRQSIDLLVRLISQSIYVDWDKEKTDVEHLGKVYELPVLKFRKIDKLDYGDFSFTCDYTTFYYETVQEYLSNNASCIPKGLIKVMGVFEEEFIIEYGEELLVLSIFLSLYSLPNDDDEVFFDYGDLLYGEMEDFYDDHYNTLVKKLVDKISIQNMFFNRIKENSFEVLDSYNRNMLKQLWEEVKKKDQSNNEKGRIFEEFITLLLKMDNTVSIESKNLVARDEELDILFSHNFGTSFWNSMNSPCILVECKNWTSKVGVSELRNFETKIRNHSNLSKVGIFFAVNGYADNSAKEYLMRLGRDEYILILIEGDDIESFLENKYSLEEFLRKTAIRSLK